jgi:hypothetical protein
MHATSASQLPLPAPRWLSAPEAAGYVGVDLEEFRSEVDEGVWPTAGRSSPSRGDLWDRMALDQASDQLSGLCIMAAPGTSPSEAAELLDADHAAKLAGCSLDTINRAPAKELPRYGRGRKRLFKRDDVVAFATSKPPSTPDPTDLGYRDILESYRR